ncbi:uncharacterized protein LOC143291865 [Babylonia areolata]|uniref:uncharacterized protein LOC143291865 n=1 Tax=Babylonia areolata TaxID=304850 RepID=UPI003FD1A3FD
MAMNVTFNQRPHGYKAGLFLLLAGLVLFIVGFSSSYWTVFQLDISDGSGMSLDHPYFLMRIKGHNGLWQTCETDFGFDKSLCGPVSHGHGAPAWMGAVQGFQCVGLIGLVAACGYAVFLNFIQQSPSQDNRHLEILVVVSSTLAVIGSVIYVSQSSGHNDIVISDSEVMFFDEFELHGATMDSNELSWGFGLNLVGCFLSFIACVILCAHGRLLPSPPEAPSVAVSFSTGGRQNLV